MADVFISYKREDRPFAERLSIVLEQLGFEVWWDFDLLSGDRYRRVIRAVIDQAKVAIVVWSARAIESDFVLDEAEYAKTQGKLCPVRMDGIAPPFGFGSIHTDDLSDWDGELFHSQFQNLVRAIEARIGRRGRLGGVAHPQEAQASAAELEAFKAAQLAGNASALRAFLSRHPRGAFSAFVRGQVAEIEAHAEASAPVAAVTEASVAEPKRSAPRPGKAPVAPPPAAQAPAPPSPLVAGAPPARDAGKSRRWPLYALAATAALIFTGYLVVSQVRRAQAIPGLDARAAPFAGRWTFQGATCENPEINQVQGGVLIETTVAGVVFRHPIESIDSDGQMTTGTGADRELFRLAGDTLTVTSKSGSSETLTRCPS